MKKTVIIVDDNNTERVVLKGFLRDEYDVLEAGSGERAIELLRDNFKNVSAVVMDIIMPGKDGLKTLVEVKANPDWRQIPVIITTGLDDEASRVRSITCGADNFVTKPINRALLLHVLQNAIRLRETAEIVNGLRRDKLTNLLNRDSFFTEAERMIKGHEPGHYLLVCFDVENFKVINDQCGIGVGDEVLRHIASSLNSFASANEGLSCRFMADKFALLSPARLKDSDKVLACAESMMNPPCLNRPIRIRVGRYHVTDLSLPINAMYDRASIAEGSVKGRFDMFRADYTEEMRERLLREQQIVNEMVIALQNGEFEPWFQPQYNHATGALIGAEALVRWRKDGKIIPPYQFIPVFEKNGFIYEVDQSVWRQVCALLRRWLDEGKDPMPVSVNISRYDLYQKDFLDVINGLVKEYELPVDLLRLEITESAFSESTKVITNVVGQLISQGFTVEIDDFGSGYSSLNTLKDVPASILKLDMRFFEATENSQRGGYIVEAVVRMAKWLGMAVIAEGVEDKMQADYLKTIGCYYIQGYYYAKPMPLESYEREMTSHSKEVGLSHLQTLENMDTNLFWDPKSMETLIFNSYVGGACIFEYYRGKTELLRVNEQYISELHGLVPAGAEIKDASIVPFLTDGERAGLKKIMDEANELEKEASGEATLRSGAQTEYIRFTTRVIAKNDERLLYYAVIVNITEQRMAERSARDASERITAIMNSSQCGITAFEIHSGSIVECIFVNERFYELLGYTPEQYAKEADNPFSRIFPDDYEKTVEATLELNEVGQTATLQMRAVRRDERIIWLRADISVVRFAKSRYPVQLASFLDITEQVEAEKSRLESAEQLQIIMSNINGSVSAILMDDMGNTLLIFGNDKYYEIFGYTKEQAQEIRLDPFSCIMPEDRGTVIAKLNQLKRDGIPVNIDYRAKKRDGGVAYIRSNSARMSMEGYGDEVIVSVMNDITRQRTLEDQLKGVVDNINGGVSVTYLKSSAPEFIFENDKYYEIVGYTREQFKAEVKNVFDIIHPDDRERAEKRFREADKGHKSYSMEYRIIQRDGTVRNILCNSTVMRLFGMDEPVQLAVSNDITVLREAQQKERKLSQQMQAIMKNVHGGIVATIFRDIDDVEIAFANDGFYELYGYTREQLEKELSSIFDLIIPEDREKTRETVARLVRERSCATYEHRCRRRDGSIVWTQVTNTVVSIADIGNTVLLVTATDVTALRLAEQQNDETKGRLQAVMNAMPSGVTAVKICKDHTELLFANDRYYQMHGITREEYDQNELSGSFALVYQEDRARVHDLIVGATEVGYRAETEYRVQRTVGTTRWVKAVISVTLLAGLDVPVQVAIFTDISAEKEAGEQLRFLNESAHDILAQPDSEAAIIQTLTKLLNYFGADRGYIIELDRTEQITNNTYEVCAEGVTPEMAKLQKVAFSPTDMWFEVLKRNNFMVIEDVNALDGDRAELRDMLLKQGIHSIFIAALRRDGELIGFVGTDNPTCAVNQVRQLTALADYLSVLLTRRDMMREIMRENETVRQLALNADS